MKKLFITIILFITTLTTFSQNFKDLEFNLDLFFPFISIDSSQNFGVEFGGNAQVPIDKILYTSIGTNVLIFQKPDAESTFDVKVKLFIPITAFTQPYKNFSAFVCIGPLFGNKEDGINLITKFGIKYNIDTGLIFNSANSFNYKAYLILDYMIINTATPAKIIQLGIGITI
jgi:hypothetical protein